MKDQFCALNVQNVSKEYKLYASPGQRMKALLTGTKTHQSHWALKDVSFTLNKGQCMGIVGDNGAGKSSLLKLIAGTMAPTHGQLTTFGRVTAILELGAGFHPDFTGRQNLYFAASLMGINAETMRKIEPEILDFAELGSAIDRQVKTYSSGMVVRLAFSLVTGVDPDVLVVDEALAVGDQHFQKKCVDRIESFRRKGCTILFCSHSLYHVRHLCDVAIWMDKGQVRSIGATEQVLSSYDAHVRLQDARTVQELGVQPIRNRSERSPLDAEIECMEVPDLVEGSPPLLDSRNLTVRVTVKMPVQEKPSIGVMLEQLNGVGITSLATHSEGVAPTRLSAGRWSVGLTFPDLPLHSGEYVLSAYLFDEKGLVVYDKWHQHQAFTFINPSLTPGLVQLPHHWS